MKITKKDVITYFIVFAFVIVVFMPWLVGHYATDTYKIIDIGYKRAAELSLNDGRVFMSLIGFCANIINIPTQVYVVVLLILALAVSTLIVLILKNLLFRYIDSGNKKLEFIALLISFITIFNFMYIENLYYVEAFVMSISLLVYIMAAKKIVYDKSLIKAMLYVILGMFCYQGTIGILFTMTFLFSILENKKINKDTIKNVIICVIMAATAILLNFIIIKIIGQIYNLKQSRLNNRGIFYNIQVIFSQGAVILTKCCEMFPKYLLLLFVLAITLLLIMFAYKHDRKHNFVNYFVLILITIGSAYATYVLSLTAFYTGRLRFTLGALVGVIFIYIYCRTEIFKKKTIYKNVSIILLAIYFVINIVNYENLMLQHKLVNKLEKEETMSINEKIEEYEQTTNQNVEKLAIVYMTHYNDDTFYKEVSNKCVLTYSALKSDWSIRGVIYHYTGRKLSSYGVYEKDYVAMLEENNLEDDDIVFVGDTAYMKIYFY